MTYPMTKEEILRAVKLHEEEGLCVDRVSAAINRGKIAVARHIKNYRRYGDSYFTDYPTPIDRK
jgi:hypothetical protein